MNTPLAYSIVPIAPSNRTSDSGSMRRASADVDMGGYAGMRGCGDAGMRAAKLPCHPERAQRVEGSAPSECFNRLVRLRQLLPPLPYARRNTWLVGGARSPRPC